MPCRATAEDEDPVFTERTANPGFPISDALAVTGTSPRLRGRSAPEFVRPYRKVEDGGEYHRQ